MDPAPIDRGNLMDGDWANYSGHQKDLFRQNTQEILKFHSKLHFLNLKNENFKIVFKNCKIKF